MPYLSASFEQSKEHLLAISDACQDRCSPRVQARLWMYAGIVLASGLSRPEQAQCAFEVATAWDPKVALDEQLATPEAKTLFLVARAKMCEQAL